MKNWNHLDNLLSLPVCLDRFVDGRNHIVKHGLLDNGLLAQLRGFDLDYVAVLLLFLGWLVAHSLLYQFRNRLDISLLGWLG